MGKALAGNGRRQGRLEALRAELEEQRRIAEEKEHQLQRYAADLRDTFVAERERAEELRASYVATVRALTNAVEARDAYTGKHAERVAAYGLELARRIDPELAANPQTEFGFLLHDVGKVAIPDGVLYKATDLAPEEQSLMRRHPVIGFEIVRGIEFLARRRADRAPPPRALRRPGLSRRPRRGRDPARRPDLLGGGRAGRHDDGPALPARASRSTGRARRSAPAPAPSSTPPWSSSWTRSPTRPSSASAPRSDSTPHMPSVLIVDDDPFIRKLIATTLEDVAGFELAEAGDGEEAVEVAARETPEMVFLDIDMPRLDGLEVCRRLRADPATASATIVILTAAAGDAAEREAEGAGADLFLTKPFSPLELLRLVHDLGAA